MAFGARGSTPADPRPLELTAWAALLRRVGSPADSAEVRKAHADLLSRWSQPHRHYHNRSHLAAVLDHVDRLDGSDLVRLAAWFHDAIYEPTRSDNEAASAALAAATLVDLGVPQPLAGRVADLVLMTATHEPAADDIDGRTLADADLAILAAPPDAYDAYAAAIRREYSHVPEDAFRRGRSALLHRMLRRDTLFGTEYGREHWERAARANIARERSCLEDARGVP